jgi:two-component system, NtrC family, sensor kinase
MLQRGSLDLFGKTSLRMRLAIGLLFVVLIPGLVSTVVGIHFINAGIIQQAQNKVRLDLNTAREIYEGHIRELHTLLEFSAVRPSIGQALREGNETLLKQTMLAVYQQAGVDFLGLTDESLHVVFRCSNPEIAGDFLGDTAIIKEASNTRRSLGGTQVLPPDILRNESPVLAERAVLHLIDTPMAKPTREEVSDHGMALMAAVPVTDAMGEFVGVIYAGDLLNRKFNVVDRIKDTVYRGQEYFGEDVGTSTIFLGDVRIATNVLDAAGQRAIGTRVSEKVHDQVLVQGNRWIDRAFVVTGWYITAYEPLRDVLGNTIGILYVGILEKPYVGMRRGIVLTFLSITGAGMALAAVISYSLSQSILRPVAQLAEGAQRLARGDFGYRIRAELSDEIGILCEAFNRMGEALLDRDRHIWESTQRQLTQSEGLASLGRLAAGVAHEINNPLTGVLTFSSLLADEPGLPPKMREDLEVIVDETKRCRDIIRNLLDFARETEPEIGLVNINELTRKTIDIIRNQSLFQNILVEERLNPALPEIPTDANQIKQVLLNLVLNAAAAMPDGGRLTISTHLGVDGRFIKISVQDTGTGIPKEHLERIFDPFFTTKEQGKGTGLGLSVSYGIVQQHKGTITVTSQVGKGSTFDVNLPVRPMDNAAELVEHGEREIQDLSYR